MRNLPTSEEVADALRITVAQVQELARRGVIPAYKVGYTWRYPEQRVEEWLESTLKCRSEAV